MTRELNVLVVDDDPIDQRLISSALRKCSDTIKIRIADGGLEALDSFTREGVPDLVVTDIKMPGIDGHQLVDLIRGTPKYCCVPVVAYSTSMDEQDIRSAYMEGANEGHGFRHPWNSFYAGLTQQEMVGDCLLGG